MVERAERVAFDARSAWRALYQMPINDPRNLAATEEEILEDLLIRRIQDDYRQEQSTGVGALLAEYRKHKAEMDETIQQHEEWIKDPGVQDTIRRLSRPDDHRPAPAPTFAPHRAASPVRP